MISIGLIFLIIGLTYKNIKNSFRNNTFNFKHYSLLYSLTHFIRTNKRLKKKITYENIYVFIPSFCIA